MHTPVTQWSWSGLIVPLCRHSVGTYQETSSHGWHSLSMLRWLSSRKPVGFWGKILSFFFLLSSFIDTCFFVWWVCCDRMVSWDGVKWTLNLALFLRNLGRFWGVVLKRRFPLSWRSVAWCFTVWRVCACQCHVFIVFSSSQPNLVHLESFLQTVYAHSD